MFIHYIIIGNELESKVSRLDVFYFLKQKQEYGSNFLEKKRIYDLL